MEAIRWLGSPRRVFGAVVSVAALLTAALGGLSWRLFEQERSLGVQRMRDRMEQAMDRANAGLLNSLAAESEQLAALAHASAGETSDKARQLVDTSPDNLLLLFTEGAVGSYPDHRLLYSPAGVADAEAPPSALTAADAAEFQSGNYAKATSLLLPLTQGGNPAVRCAALLRLARIQRKTGNVGAALATYRQLEQFGARTVDGLPAELLARHARCDLLAASGHPAPRGEVDALAADLRGARWALGRGSYLFYSAEMRRLGAAPYAEDPTATAMADAVEALWKQWQNIRRGEAAPNGQRSLRVNKQPWVLVWWGSAERLAGRVAAAGYIERRWLSAAVVKSPWVRVGISGPDGLPILPLAGAPDSPRVSRTLTNSPLQWTLEAASTNPQADFAQMAAGRNVLFGGLGFVLLLATAGGYAIARAVHRELEVARLQSDFVSAVSHEFRTPLTTLQQLSELLAKGRVPGEERRQRYYEVISGETRRLHRLVEDLLDFGRIEAGAAVYRPRAIEVREFLREVVGDFQAGAECRGYSVVLNASDADVLVEADPEALRRALWNLLDNAVKYSPNGDTVWVEAEQQSRSVTICVRDRGMGIALDDQRRIFRKFMRGVAAKTASIRGTGLGLAMVHHIVKAHRGEIGVVSEPGQGSAFTIKLPAHRLDGEAHGAGAMTESEGS